MSTFGYCFWRLSAKQLFLFGLVIHFAYSCFLLSTNNYVSGFFSLEGLKQIEAISFFHSDAKSYIEEAVNINKLGLFNENYQPSYHRTIGYPLIIALFISVFGKFWYLGLIMFQNTFSALVYPIVYKISLIINNQRSRSAILTATLLLLLGGFFTRTCYVLTDLCFSSFLLFGIYLSIKAIYRISWITMTLGIVIIGMAGFIRPIMMLYFIVHFILMIYIINSKCNGDFNQRKWLIGISTFTILLITNMNSYFMHRTYDFKSPTDVLGINLFHYTTKYVLESDGQNLKYMELFKEIDSEVDFKKKDELRKKFAFEAIKTYPLAAIKYWVSSGFSHLLLPHYLQIGKVFGFYKRDKVIETGLKLKKSFLVQIIFFLFAFVNLILLFLLPLIYLIHQIRQKNFLIILLIISVLIVLFAPTFFASNGERLRMPIEWILLAISSDVLIKPKHYLGNLIR